MTIVSGSVLTESKTPCNGQLAAVSGDRAVTQRLTTMKQQLYLLIAKHGLHEVLDRLREMVVEQAELNESSNLDQVAAHLEHALEESLKAAETEWS